MVTVPRDPPSCPPATVTWTLVLDAEETAVLCGTPSALCLSPRGSRELTGGGTLGSALTPEEESANLAGCGKQDAVDTAAMSELKVRVGVGVRAWSPCKASCLSCWSGVEQTWQLLMPAWGLAGLRSCSNRKVAYPGSCGDITQKERIEFHACTFQHLPSSTSHNLLFLK